MAMIMNTVSEGSWRTSARCVPEQNCVEINRERSDRVGVRDSKHPVDGSTLEFRASAWGRFVAHIEEYS